MGANNTMSMQIYLGMQPRLLREMLQLALSHLIEDAAITEFHGENAGRMQANGANGNHPSPKQWLIISTPAEDGIDKRIQVTLAQHQDLQIAALGPDARTLHVYSAARDGAAQENKVQETTYQDFSLAQLVQILQGAGA